MLDHLVSSRNNVINSDGLLNYLIAVTADRTSLKSHSLALAMEVADMIEFLGVPDIS